MWGRAEAVKYRLVRRILGCGGHARYTTMHGSHRMRRPAAETSFLSTDDSSEVRRCSCAELQRCAADAVGFLEAAASMRAGGQPATVRTVAYSGHAGVVSFSLIGEGQSLDLDYGGIVSLSFIGSHGLGSGPKACWHRVLQP